MKILADSKSHFSIGESVLTPEAIAEHAAKAGYDAAALCDTMTISGMPDFTKACDKHGIKPVVGVRLRIVPSLDKESKQFAVYPKLYILTNEGFEIVTKLISLAYEETHFHAVPRLTWADVIDALKHAKGHVSYSTSTLYSAIRDVDALDATRQIAKLLTLSHTFVEIVPANSAVWDRQAEVAYDLVNNEGFSFLLSKPALYAKADGSQTLGHMNSVVKNFKSGNGFDFKPHIEDYRVVTPSQLVVQAVEQSNRIKVWNDKSHTFHLRRYGDGWKNLCDSCEFKWQKLDVSLPKMAPDEDARLWELAKEGFKKRLSEGSFGHKPSDLKPYAARLKYEMGVLTDMGFSGYFLLTHEIVKWSKDNGILVGPGRGSVGGSLLAYLLEITDVDPIRFGLIFERFINPERIDLPDADLDFMSTRRHEVIQHIKDQYGQDRVAAISNYTTLGSRAAIRDLSRILGDMEGQGLGKFIPEEQGTAISLERAFEEVAEVKAYALSKPDIWSTACDIEGVIRSLSVHAAGIVVAGEPLIKRAIVEQRKGEHVVNWDKRVVEDMGLVKMDILGLSTLDLISIAVRKVKERTGEDLDLLKIPLDNETVLKAFGTGQTVGIFQFESGGMRKLLKDIYKTGRSISFEEVSACTALYRPGPMESGLLDDFVAIKQGESSEMYVHQSTRAALEETYSVIVYQEQVMQIARDLSGFSMAEADILRKAIGKKDADLMKTMSEKFINGAQAGMIEVELDDGTKKTVHRLTKFICDDGVKRTVEEAQEDGVDITL